MKHVSPMLIAGALVLGACKKDAPPPAPPEPDVKSQAFLAQLAEQSNKRLPMPVDEETEWLSTTGLEGTLVYTYRLRSLSRETVNAKNILAVMRPNITKSSCANPEARDTLLGKGVVLRYAYVDKAKVAILHFDVTEKDCKALEAAAADAAPPTLK